jgi:hypothetical protein
MSAAMTQAEVVAHVLGILDDLGIGYMVAGSFASNYHGAPRMTQDADIVVDARVPAILALVERLAPDFYVNEDAARQAVQTRGMFNAIHFDTGFKVDVIVKKARPFSDAELARRQPGALAGRTVMFATAEDTILTKLEWARLGQSERQDAAQLVRLQADRLDWAYIEHWAEHLGVSELVARLRRGASWADS